jgi:hypothetical protein
MDLLNVQNGLQHTRTSPAMSDISKSGYLSGAIVPFGFSHGHRADVPMPVYQTSLKPILSQHGVMRTFLTATTSTTILPPKMPP